VLRALFPAYKTLAEQTEEAAAIQRGWNATAERGGAIAEYYARQERDAAEATDHWTRAVDGAMTASMGMRQEQEQLAEAHRRDRDRLQELADAAEQVDFTKWAVGADFTENLEQGQQQLEGLRGKAEELRGKIAELEGATWPGAQGELDDLRGQLSDVESDIDDVTQSMKEMAAQFVLGLIEMQITADGEISAIEAQMYTTYAEQMGLIDKRAAEMATTVTDILTDATLSNEEKMLALMKATRDAVEAYDALGSTGQQSLSDIAASGDATIEKLEAIGLSAEAAQLAIDRMHGKDIEIGIKWNATPLTIPGSGGQVLKAPTGDFAHADGGTIPMNSVGLVGEEGPELAFPRAGGTEIVPLGGAMGTPMSAQASGGAVAGGPIWNGDIIIQGSDNTRATADAVITRLQDRGMIPRVAYR
jgi:hypothetical protein